MNYEYEISILRELYDKGRFDNEYYRAFIPGREAFESYEVFRKIPFMMKDSLRQYSAFERSVDPTNEIFGIFSSSGTTGAKTYYILSKEDKRIHEECVRSFFSELGLTENDLGAILAPVDTGIMAHTMMWQYTTIGAGYVNCPQPIPENIIALVDDLPITALSSRPDVLASVDENAELVCKARRSHVRILLPGGAFLSEGRRLYLECLWDAECFNIFGMSEIFGPLAVECRRKDGQHYPAKYVMIEILDTETLLPVEDSRPGFAVYTTLWEKGFPLVRYWSDDIIAVDHVPCACGSPMPRLRYHGRVSDMIKIGHRLFFPKDFEEMMFKSGYHLNYTAEYKAGAVDVRIETEAFDSLVPLIVMEEIDDFFGTHCSIRHVRPRSLTLEGEHGKHFSMR